MKENVTLKKLIDAAVSEFGKNGFTKTTVKQITDRAGVGKGTFYLYFETKEDVVRIMIESMINSIVIIMDNALKKLKSEKINFKKLLHDLITITLREYFSLKDLLLTITYSNYELSHDLTSFKNKSMQDIYKKVKQLLDVSIEKKYIRHVNSTVISQLMMSLFINFSLEVLFKEGTSKLNHYVKIIEDFIYFGLANPSARGK